MNATHEVDVINAEDTQTFVTTGNPLSYLTDNQVSALAKRFNKSWLKPRETQVEELQNLYGMDAFTAMFTVALIEDANTLISNARVNSVADSVTNWAQDILRGSSIVTEEALRQIKNLYDTLAPIQRPQCGKKIRTSVFKNNTLKNARVILDAMLGALETRESEWM
jgi:hypothetical protein